MTTMGTPPDEPNPTPASEPQAAAPSGAVGTLSPDGRWVWDGTQWQPAGGPPVAPPGYGAPPGFPGYGGMPMMAVGPAPGLAYAGFWLRVGAAVIDGVIIVALFIVLGTIAGVTATKDDLGNASISGVGVLAFLLGIVAVAVYQIALVAEGGTWGMRALKLRVASADTGANIGLARALGRWAVMVAISFVPFGGLLDVLWICWDERKQAIHDKAVNTFVVRPVAP